MFTLPAKLISVKDDVGINLILRDSADELFDEIESMEHNDIIIDFNHVATTTRSFMHQFLRRLDNCDKHVNCTNQPQSILKMIRVVKFPRKKTAVIHPDSENVVYLN